MSSALRFIGSDMPLVEASYVDEWASAIADFIKDGQCDGYTCVNKPLAHALTAYLATMTSEQKWCFHLRFDENEQRYRIWVER